MPSNKMSFKSIFRSLINVAPLATLPLCATQGPSDHSREIAWFEFFSSDKVSKQKASSSQEDKKPENLNEQESRSLSDQVPEQTASFCCSEEKNLEKSKRTEKEISTPSPCIALLSASHIEGGGIGYNDGYSSLAALLFPVRNNSPWWPFFDMRGHLFNRGKWAANGGVGFRYASDAGKRSFGANIYYDYRQAHSNFSQIGTGLEMLSRPLDIWLNGYFPFTNSQSISGGRKESAMMGGNFAIGRFLSKMPSQTTYKTINLYGSVGTYYFHNSHHHAVGGNAQLTLSFLEYVALTGLFSYDNLFRAQAQGELALNFPLGCPPKCKKRQAILTRPVQRNEIIVLDRYR